MGVGSGVVITVSVVIGVVSGMVDMGGGGVVGGSSLSMIIIRATDGSREMERSASDEICG